MAIMAHPDDAELNCLGTMLKHLDEHGVAFILNGVAKTLDDSGPEGKRIVEMENALSSIKINYDSLNLKDGAIIYDHTLIQQIRDRVEKINPHIVITHFPDCSGIEHQDHTAIGKAVYNCAIKYCTHLERLLFVEPLFSEATSFTPNYFVNITQYYEQKIACVKKYVSQSSRVYMQDSFHQHRASSHNYFINYGSESRDEKYESFQLAYEYVR